MLVIQPIITEVLNLSQPKNTTKGFFLTQPPRPTKPERGRASGIQAAMATHRPSITACRARKQKEGEIERSEKERNRGPARRR